MIGACAVFDPDCARRSDIVCLLTQTGAEPIVEADELADLNPEDITATPANVAVIGVTDPDEVPLALISRYRVYLPDCLILAIDAVDTDSSVARIFAAGAHDVLRLPFRPAEFEARMAKGLARKAPHHAQIEDAVNEMIGRFNLTQIEGRILRVLSARHGQIVSRDELSQLLYGQPWTYGDRRFDVHITRIRRKLSKGSDGWISITTIRSVGYKLEFLNQS